MIHIKENLDVQESNYPTIPNDYMGMAQDLRRLYENLREKTDFIGSCVNVEKINYLKQIKSFESYCLDQTDISYFENYISEVRNASNRS